MEHFVAYHNRDVNGPYNEGKITRIGQDHWFFTAKRFRRETLVGNRLWGIEGSSTSRRYSLVATGIIYDLEKKRRPAPYRGTGMNVNFRIDNRRLPLDVTQRPWFKRLLREQNSFRFGLNKISNRQVIRQFERLANGAPESELSKSIVENFSSIDLSRTDPPKRVLRAIKQRQGQPQFRNAVLAAYESRCSISKCDAVAALDAAHIIPFSGGRSHRLNNALLLRTDLHTLFDLGLIAVNTKSWTAIVAPELRTTAYGRFHGQKVQRPKNRKHHPDPRKLNKQRKKAGLFV